MKLKKIAGGLISLSLISTLLLSSCDLFSGGAAEEEKEEQTTPSTPETPNIFSGKTYLRESSNMVFKFISNTKVELTKSDGTTKTYFWKLDETNSQFSVGTNEKNPTSYGTFHYDFMGKTILLKLQDTDGWIIYGVWVDSSDTSIVKEPEVKTDASTATASETWEVTADSVIKKITSNVKDVALSGAISGKKLYVVNTNPADTIVSKDKVRLVKSYSSASAPDFSYTRTGTSNAEVVEALNDGITEFHEDYINLNDYAIRCDDELLGSRAASVVKDWKVGDTKEIFVGSERSNAEDGFEKLPITLWAVGKHCYVWIADEYLDESTEVDTPTEGSAKVQKGTAKTYQEKFDSIYEVEKNIFGNDPDVVRVLYKNNGGWYYKPNADIETISDTGKMVNIVIYDVEFNDNGSKNQGGTIGYFFSKDLYCSDEVIDDPGIKVYNKSNRGKYLYMDSTFINNRRNKTYGTIAHEFQHMINCGMKDIGISTSADTNYNEMCSMLAEDMLSEFIGLEADDTPKVYRTNKFNETYALAGAREWNKSQELTSYAQAYTFGAWLTREYGGAALVQKILSNAFVGDKSITVAVNDLNGTAYSYADLFAQYLQAVTGSSKYTFNKDAKTTVTFKGTDGKEYNYPMTGYDIYDAKFAWEDSAKNKHNGPKLYDLNEKVDLAAKYGFIIREISVPDNATDLSISFDEAGVENDIIYLIVK